MPANEFNVHGYHENERLVSFHTAILDALGSSWHDLRILPENRFQKEWMDEATVRLSDILEAEFRDAERILVKDPRVCRLLPLWHQLASERNFDLRCVLIGRHPLQVASSLAERDHFSCQKSLLLWLQYNLLAERGTRSGRRLVIRYRDLLENPGQTMKRVAGIFELEDERLIEKAGSAIDSSFVHYALEPDTFCEQPELQNWASEVWNLLFLKAQDDASARERLDQIFLHLSSRLSIFPEEANGLGDYEAALTRRSLVSLEQRHQAALQRAESAEKNLQLLKSSYQAQNESLRKVMRQRDGARSDAASLSTQHKELHAHYQQESQSLREKLQRAGGELKLTQDETKALQESEAKLRRTLNSARAGITVTREERELLEELMRRTAREIVEREARRSQLQRELEDLRRGWSAVLVRTRLKHLLGQITVTSPDLPELNAAHSSVWNLTVGGFTFGANIFADPGKPGDFSIEGWIIAKSSDLNNRGVRLVTDSGQRYKASRGIHRIDIPLLYPHVTLVAQSGFSIAGLMDMEGQRGRLEIRKASGEWTAVAAVDFNGIGWQHYHDIDAIVTSKLFDEEWYAKQYQLQGTGLLSLISHYLRAGAVLGFFPNSLFDSAYYLSSNPEIVLTGENPLLHYLRATRQGQRPQPNRLFDSSWYLMENKDVASRNLDPFSHYLHHGLHEKRNPGPFFDVKTYLAAHPSVGQSELDALSHFIHCGAAQGYEAPPVDKSIHWIYETEVDESKKNLLLVGHVLAEKVFGGERSLLELLQLIDRKRFNIYCSFPQAGSLLQSIQPFAAGIVVFPYRWWQGSAVGSDGYDEHFEKIMRERRIDLVHVNSIVLRDPLIAAQRLGIPSVLHLREIITFDPDLAKRIGLPPEQIASEVSNRCDFLIANSLFSQTQQGKPGRSFVLYNTADEAAFDLPVRSNSDPMRVGMISSNLPKKGLEDFFKIAREAEQRKDPLEFWLVGPITKWVQEEMARNGGCPNNVRRVGYVTEPAEILREIDVVINLSTFAESFGRSVAEGMLARRPAVVYDYGALRELIRDGNDGFVVPFRDVDAALKRLNELAQNPRLREEMGQSARQRALVHFSRSVGRQTLRRIHDVILQGSKSGDVQGQAFEPKRKMRIGYFMWHFPVPSETFVLNELRDFVRLGYDVVVFCKESPYKEFQPDFSIEWRRVTSADDLAIQIKESGREIMHSHFLYPTVTRFLWPACEAAGVPFTFIAHAVDIFRYENAANNRLAEVARSPLCRRVFAPGTFHREFFIQQGVPEDKIVINPQGISFGAYEAQPIGPRLEHPRMSICAIHRFVEKKGLQIAIRAAKELAPFSLSLHIYGYGPLEQSYHDLVAELGLENVFFRGPVRDRAHMISVFREHDLFLCPSVRAEDGDMDGIPTILVEAMASHLPVVTSRISSIPDLVVDALTGFVCEPNDIGSLRDAILRFYQEPAVNVRAIIENARELVRKKFDVARSNRTLARVWANEGIDVILVTYDALAEVREVIGRLYRFTKTPFQLYIVDNGSSQETLDYLRSVAAEHGNVTVLPQKQNLFVGPGTNKGLEAGRAPIAVYICSREGYVLTEGWDQEILNFMEDHPEVGLAGTLGYSPSYFTGIGYIERLEPFAKFRNPEFAARNPDRHFYHVQGGLIAIRRRMFESIGGFSEAVPHDHTDVEYSYYSESCGWKLARIPQFAIIYHKSRPVVSARLSETTYAIHPGSAAMAPLLNSIARQEIQFCNICAQPVIFEETRTSKLVCSSCGSTPFQRTLFRFLAESNLTYRNLVSLFAGELEWVLPEWGRMFRGRAITWAQVCAEIEEKGRIEHENGELDLAVLHLSERTRDRSSMLLPEMFRVLKPGATMFYSQPYGMQSVFGAAKSGRPLLHSANVADALESSGFQVQTRIRYASSVVRYSEHDIFVCRRNAE